MSKIVRKNLGAIAIFIIGFSFIAVGVMRFVLY